MKKIIILTLFILSLSLGLVSATCSDGIDDDGDGLIDYPEDPGCGNADSANEIANGVTIFNECTVAEGTGCGTKTDCHYDADEQEIGYCLGACETDFDCTSTFGDTYSCTQASSSSELYCLEIDGCYDSGDSIDRSVGGYVVTTYYQGSTDYMLVDYCSPIGQVEYYCSGPTQASSSVTYTEDIAEGEVCYDGSIVRSCDSDLDCVIGHSCNDDGVCLTNDDACSIAGCDMDGDSLVEEILYETGDERVGVIGEKNSCETAGGFWFGDVAEVCASGVETDEEEVVEDPVEDPAIEFEYTDSGHAIDPTYVLPEMVGSACRSHEDCGEKVYCLEGTCKVTKCHNGIDDDSDGFFDYQEGQGDPNCAGYSDNTEAASRSTSEEDTRAARYGAPEKGSSSVFSILLYVGIGLVILGLILFGVYYFRKRR
jgi:hypothetical protein